MRWLVDIAYLIFLCVASPVIVVSMLRRGTLRTDWPSRFGRVSPGARRSGVGRRVMLHAVSVGEVNAIRGLVPRLHASGVEVVVAVTTETGFQRASTLFGDRHVVVRYPLDLSWCVARFLNAVKPDLVGLVELEVWPNFTRACMRRGIPVQIINGRLTARSLRRYRRVLWLVRPMFLRIDRIGAQDEAHAERFRALGIPPDRVTVDGTMKWDNAQLRTGVDGSEQLREAMGIDPDRPLVVAGSTAPDEHELLQASVPEGCQLLCAPRRPEWFDGAADVLAGCARRSAGTQGSTSDRFLLDTIGELSQAYALADVVVIGRSFGSLHGSDMIEPIGLGVVTIIGPAVSDFESIVDALRAGDGLIQTDRSGLAGEINRLLADGEERRRIARNGQAVIVAMQGATDRAASALLQPLG
jgi:3-deoxy-D-manno-octulosonic-acid transferase